jgi:tRNA-specific 2-thiouridylase
MRSAPDGTGADRPVLESRLDEARRPAVVVGMSGGVDSAIALHSLVDQHAGAAVVGATLRLWIDPSAPDPDSACCSPDSVRRARITCHAAGMPHVSIDLRQQFARDVVVPFVTDYATGRTPNPCVRCNGHFRMDELVRLADVLGATHVATGHYARIVERAGSPLIARGADRTKDQSYMLGEVPPATTARLQFPLGGTHKTEVRADASRLGLEQATVAESQEVCFLGGGDYRKFLARAGASGAPGEIVLAGPDGETVVGHHDGVARFTPGQRKGLGVASHAPLYVLDVDAGSGRVLVGHDGAALEQARVLVDKLAWHAADDCERVHVQLRYRARDGAIPARLVRHDDGTAELELDRASRAPAPGQAAILYDDDGLVVASGRISRDPAVARLRSDR